MTNPWTHKAPAPRSARPKREERPLSSQLSSHIHGGFHDVLGSKLDHRTPDGEVAQIIRFVEEGVASKTDIKPALVEKLKALYGPYDHMGDTPSKAAWLDNGAGLIADRMIGTAKAVLRGNPPTTPCPWVR